MRKADLYKWIKIGGLLSFLPFVLVAGPLSGYILGNYLEKRFNLPSYVSLICITVGFIASLKETIRIVKITLKADKES